ncbi:Protein CBG18652 [Caenorhabditis briggsae]|uniref:Protein CBG18652 n=1 Tax=Caenorhabditis briggsae TaxID=6238 RepID=A8XTT7_CAEBR|nr:Protein CBG18652 [Caenorhabditis briggsae]CAP36063.1 Protein CBG18652 [Caenorhabditis briggsae]
MYMVIQFNPDNDVVELNEFCGVATRELTFDSNGDFVIPEGQEYDMELPENNFGFNRYFELVRKIADEESNKKTIMDMPVSLMLKIAGNLDPVERTALRSVNRAMKDVADVLPPTLESISIAWNNLNTVKWKFNENPTEHSGFGKLEKLSNVGGFKVNTLILRSLRRIGRPHGEGKLVDVLKIISSFEKFKTCQLGIADLSDQFEIRTIGKALGVEVPFGPLRTINHRYQIPKSKKCSDLWSDSSDLWSDSSDLWSVIVIAHRYGIKNVLAYCERQLIMDFEEDNFSDEIYPIQYAIHSHNGICKIPNVPETIPTVDQTPAILLFEVNDVTG